VTAAAAADEISPLHAPDGAAFFARVGQQKQLHGDKSRYAPPPPNPRYLAMAVPKKKKSQSRRDMRRAHHDKRSPPTLVACPNCEEKTLSHRACPACGHYKGRQVVAVVQE
jgi:large subunit ribosomal protein L32